MMTYVLFLIVLIQNDCVVEKKMVINIAEINISEAYKRIRYRHYNCYLLVVALIKSKLG